MAFFIPGRKIKLLKTLGIGYGYIAFEHNNQGIASSDSPVLVIELAQKTCKGLVEHENLTQEEADQLLPQIEEVLILQSQSDLKDHLLQYMEEHALELDDEVSIVLCDECTVEIPHGYIRRGDQQSTMVRNIMHAVVCLETMADEHGFTIAQICTVLLDMIEKGFLFNNGEFDKTYETKQKERCSLISSRGMRMSQVDKVMMMLPVALFEEQKSARQKN